MNDDLFSNVELFSTDVTVGLEKSNLLQNYLIGSIMTPTLSPTILTSNYSDNIISSRDDVILTKSELTAVVVFSGFGFLLVVFLFLHYYYCIKEESKKAITEQDIMSNEIVNSNADIENSSFYNVDTADVKSDTQSEEKIEENSLILTDVTLQI